jgi:hypothetical protein
VVNISTHNLLRKVFISIVIIALVSSIILLSMAMWKANDPSSNDEVVVPPGPDSDIHIIPPDAGLSADWHLRSSSSMAIEKGLGDITDAAYYLGNETFPEARLSTNMVHFINGSVAREFFNNVTLMNENAIGKENCTPIDIGDQGLLINLPNFSQSTIAIYGVLYDGTKNCSGYHLILLNGNYVLTLNMAYKNSDPIGSDFIIDLARNELANMD